MQNKIQTYIDKNANSTIQKRGQNLLKNNAIKDFIIDVNKDEITFLVQGSYVYEINIRNLKGNLKTSCNCPYDWGGICKHEVASLLYLKNYLQDNSNNNSENKKELKNILSSTWQEIPDFKNISRQLIYSLSDAILFHRTENNYNYSFDSKLYEIKTGHCTFETNEYYRSNNVEFKITKDKLYSKCNCTTKNKGLCKHQICSLLTVKDKYGHKFFKNIEKSEIEKFKKETFDLYGIPQNENFNDWFTLKFDNKYIAKPKEKAVGLVKIKKYRSPEISLNNVLNRIDTTIDYKKQEDNLYISYVFSFVEKIKTNKYFELIEISGKPNKNKTDLSYIKKTENLRYYNNISLTEENEQLYNICKQLSFDNKSRSFFRDEEQIEDTFLKFAKFYFHKIEIIFSLLKGKRFIYKTTERNFYKRDLILTKLSEKIPKLHFKVYDDETFAYLSAYVTIDNVDILINSEHLNLTHILIIEHNNTFYRINSIKEAFTIYQYYNSSGFLKIIKSEFDAFFEDFIKPISKYYPVEFNLSNFKNSIKQMIAKEKRLYISELGNFVIFNLTVIYDDKISINALTSGNYIEKNKNTIKTSFRDAEFEKEFLDFFKSLHPKLKKQFREDFLHLQIDDLLENYWFFDAFEKIRKNNIEVFGLNNLKNFKYSTNKAKINVNINSEEDWFDINIKINFGDASISLKNIKKAILKQDRFVKLDDGTIGIMPKEWFEKFEKYFRHGEIKGDKLKISKLKFSIIEELFKKIDYQEIFAELLEKKEKLKQFSKIKNVRPPQKLLGKLRDYQKAGYNWLNFLDEFKWGGILADDMGLGKTIQILAFLLKQKSKSKKANLIVVPTTLLFNWKNEIEKFTPDLNTLFYHGTSRKKEIKDFKKYNLIITTYGVMMQDIQILRKYLFNYIILDESQAIKNPNSKRFKAATIIRASNRIALTGTPIENNTFDLYAQTEFLNPGFLGSQKHFKENYSNPIDKEHDSVRASELQNLISPFILRRTKEQVAKELPPKTEDFVYCEMETEQRKVYDAFRNKYRNFLLNKIEDEGIGKSKIYIIEGLMKLRQICDSPEILSDKEDYGKESIKIKELTRHVKNKTGKHKILVFSQFVKMLKIISRELKKEKIEFEYLDGQSSQKNRQASVKNFQENKNVRVFLISLKAGGTGINLTAADYVYIFDPWWNPAVENQAIDRCYRTGQDKKVIAYRMICKNTIEEKIMRYQDKKRKVASEIITTDDSFVKNLKKEDIVDLFE